MPKHKPEDVVATAPNEASVATALSPADPARDDDTAHDGVYSTESRWVSWFGIWGDSEVGVRLIEDRQNRRMTIKFDQKPSEAVRALMTSEQYGYRFDGEDKVWFKPIHPARPRDCREQAEELALNVANIIREEMGLEPKKAVSLAL